MRTFRNTLNRAPRVKSLLKSVYWSLQGLPPVCETEISREVIHKYVGKEDPTILDIGCNDGTHTLWFLEIFTNPKIYSFEPDPRAISRFKKKVGNASNVMLFEMVLSDREGEIDFYQSGGQLDENQAQIRAEGWDLSGSIRQPKEHLTMHPWITFENKISVPSSTLDTWAQQQGIESIDWIWMDVQGAEIDVLRGARKTLAKTRFLYTEYNNQELYEGQVNLKNLLKYLSDFKVVIRYPDDILLSNKHWEGKPKLP